MQARQIFETNNAHYWPISRDFAVHSEQQSGGSVIQSWIKLLLVSFIYIRLIYTRWDATYNNLLWMETLHCRLTRHPILRSVLVGFSTRAHGQDWPILGLTEGNSWSSGVCGLWYRTASVGLWGDCCPEMNQSYYELGWLARLSIPIRLLWRAFVQSSLVLVVFFSNLSRRFSDASGDLWKTSYRLFSILYYTLWGTKK